MPVGWRIQARYFTRRSIALNPVSPIDSNAILEWQTALTACAYRICDKSCVFTIVDLIRYLNDSVILTESIISHNPAQAYAS